MQQLLNLVRPLIKVAFGALFAYWVVLAGLFGILLFIEQFDDTPCEVSVYEVAVKDLNPYAEPGTYEADRRDTVYAWLMERGFAEHLDVYYNALENNEEIWDRIEQIDNATTLSDRTKEEKVQSALRDNARAAERAFRESVEDSGLEIQEMEWCVASAREAAL